MKRLLVIRLSALGDVAILAPVVRARAEANPEVLFMVAAPARLQALFEGISNIQFVATAKRQSPKELYRQWMALQPDMVADMHHVNRIVAADWLMMLHGKAVYHIHKEKFKRWQMMRRWGKVRRVLTPSWQRYDDVFDRCGLKPSTLKEEQQHYWRRDKNNDGQRHIGIAPMSQHKGKNWPLEQMEQLVGMLADDKRNHIYLFGGADEKPLFDRWLQHYANTTSLAGTPTLGEELQAMARLDVMVSMDSANMHFASCVGVPVVSVWGATHPDAGFYGWRQDPRWAVQKNLCCRPCSPFGNKACRYGDYRCLKSITPEMVLEKIEAVLN